MAAISPTFRRPLGDTGLWVDPVSLGTVKIGRNTSLKYPVPFELPSAAAVEDLLRCAAHHGVLTLDTAPAYGSSEERIGSAMRATRWFAGDGARGREDWVIVTKAGEEFDPASGTSRFDFSGPAITASVDRSRARLGIDYIDVVLLHSDGRDEHILRESGALDALSNLKQRGIIRAFGISAKSVDGGILAVSDPTIPRSDVIMITINPAEPDGLNAARAAHAAGAGVLVKKALASGRLRASTANADPVAESLRLSLSAGVSSVVIGTLSPQHLVQAVNIARGLAP